MNTRPSFYRWAFSVLVLITLFASSLSYSLARVETALQPISTATAHSQKKNSIAWAPIEAPNAAPGDNDLSLTMTVPSGDLTPKLGDTINFTIKVTNNGTVSVTGITVKDILPSGLTYSSDDGGGTYNKTTGIWVVGALLGGDVAQLKITAKVSTISAVDNIAEIWTADPPPDPDSIPGNGNISEDDYAKVTINPQKADLSITKTVNNATPVRNEIIQFTITVTNSGPNEAQNVTVKDLLPAGLVYVSDSDGGITYNPGTGIWSVGTLLASGPGSSDTIIISARVDTPGNKVNIAEVWTSDQVDPDSTPGNGLTEDDYDGVVIKPKSADLSISKSIDIPVPIVGQTVKFLITVSNSGPDAATGVSVLDVLPSGYTYVSDTGSGSYNSGTGIWMIGGLAASGLGASAQLEITAIANVNIVPSNWAEVWTSNEFDPDSSPGDGSKISDDDDGAPFSDLSITKTVDKTSVDVGANVKFTVIVTNTGPGSASNVLVKDALPPEFSFVSVETSVGTTYDDFNGIWDVGSLAPAGSATMVITAKALSVGTIVNWAEIWDSDQGDPDSTAGDNSTTTDDDASAAVKINPAYVQSKTIVITEVAWMGTAASADDEWIELFNASNAPVDLTGWQIRSFRSGSGDTVFAVIYLSAPSTCTPDCVIEPGEFFLLERTDDNTVKDIDADITYQNSVTFGGTSHSTQLSNSGEMLLLCSPNNISAGTCKPSQDNLYITVGDIVNIQTITNGTPAASNLWPGGSSSTLGSMERQSLISNEDTTWFTHTGASPRWGIDANNNNIKGTPKHPNWAYTVTATPRPTNTPQKTATPVPQPAPILVLNEFVPRPGHDWNNDGQVNNLDEFVEVVNAGQVPVNLSQYKLDDYEEDANGNEIKNGFSLPSRTLQPGEIAVFYASDTGFFLSDAGDTVRLVKASNYTIVDAVTYPAVKSLDMSYCRYTDGYGSWLNRCFPTPGLPNSLTGGSFPPDPGDAISDICLLPDNAPVEFVLAECEQSGLGIWNPKYWDSFPGEGDEFWLYELWYKWLEIFQ